MPGKVIGKDLNYGYAGKISRNDGTLTVNARIVKSILNGSGNETMPVIPFGKGVVVNSDNTYSLFGATGTDVASPTAASFAGIAVAEVQQAVTYGNVSETGGYVGGKAADVITMGSVTVECVEGTPALGGDVYCVSVASTSGGTAKIGDIIATSSPAGTGGTAVKIANAKWKTGKIDANKIAEIELLAKVNI